MPVFYHSTCEAVTLRPVLSSEILLVDFRQQPQAVQKRSATAAEYRNSLVRQPRQKLISLCIL